LHGLLPGIFTYVIIVYLNGKQKGDFITEIKVSSMIGIVQKKNHSRVVSVGQDPILLFA